MNPLEGLNSEQAKAVAYVGGPSLIFAGAGSGKTKVLTHKIAYLIDQQIISPEHILAVTFTNKAAKELRSRIENYVGKKVRSATIGTFHSICAQILRREIEPLGFTSGFTIYDEADQLSLMKKVIAERSIILQGITPQNILSKISSLKSKWIEPESYQPRKGILPELLVKQIYPYYQEALKQANSLDFDDLLIFPLKIFTAFPEVLEKYRRKYKFILVDEYQDTNKPQFMFIDALGKKHRRVCVVGDDDQSIYSWRGADIENILRFESAFPKAKVFKLEQNYRSTNTILKAASAVVSNNVNRAKKTLWSKNQEGEPLNKIQAEDEYDEAARIASCIQNEILHAKRKFKDFAILYRTNAQSRVLEDILRRNNIVYVLVGGVKFYDRKEIKDTLAFFHLLCNPKDDVSFKRIVNFPPRGIGKTTLEYVENFAHKNHLSLYESLPQVDSFELSPRSIQALAQFYQMVLRIQSSRTTLSFEEWSRIVVLELGLRDYFKELGGEEALERLANVDELLNDISKFCSDEQNPTLESYLEKVALNTQIDSWEDTKNAVSLMTLHSAKGLEFPVVFICGLNQGLLPMERDMSEKSIEEERRLFYVGLTRAKEKIYLSCSESRMYAGETKYSSESRFLSEIPPELIWVKSRKENVISASRQQRKSYQKKTVDKSETSGQPFVVPEASRQIQIGSIVTHQIFGVGKVLGIDGYGLNAKLHILFRSAGQKTIVAKYVKLSS